MLKSFGIIFIPWGESFTEYVFLKTFYDIKEKNGPHQAVIV